MTDNNDKLKIVADAPSMVVVLDAVTQAQAVLTTYTIIRSSARRRRR